MAEKDGTADSRITMTEKDGTTDPKFRMTENVGTTEPMAAKGGTTEPMAENVGTTDLRVRLAEKDGKPLVSGLCDSTGHSVSGRQDGSVDGPQSTWEERTMKTSPDDDDNDDTDVVPYDRGWAWMVVLGSVINYALISAHLKTMGVFFVELRHYFHAPASHTALLFAIRGGVSSIAGMFIMNVVIGRLGCRKTALIGAVLMTLSAILSSLANDLILLISLQAVLLGVSDCMLGSTGEVLTARYFRKRRFVAMAVIKAGASVASIAYPPLLALLLRHYGLRGALLLSGGLSLHALPAALLLRPTSYFRKKGVKKGEGVKAQSKGVKAVSPASQNLEEACQTSSKRQQKKYSDVASTNQQKHVEKVTVKYDTGDQIHNSEDVDQALKRALVSEIQESFKSAVVEEEEAFVHADDQGSHKKLTIDMTKQISVDDQGIQESKSLDMAYTMSVDDQDIQESKTLLEQNDWNDKPVKTIYKRKYSIQAQDDKLRDDTVTHRPPLPQRLKSALCVLDFSLFRRPPFVLLFFYYMLSPNINVGLDYLPALAQQQGMSKAQAAQLLSIVGALDLVSRLSVGLVTNLQIVPVPVLAGVALTGLGTVYQCTRWTASFELLVALAAAQGVLAGVVNGLTSLLILHVVGVAHLAKGIGFQLLAEGAFSSAFHPLLGYIRDRTGSYVVVYHVTGCCLLAAALVLLCEEVMRKREKTRLMLSEERRV